MSVDSRQELGSSRVPFRDSASRIVFVLSAAFAVWCLVQQAASFRSLVPPVGLVQAAIFGVIAALIARGSRRALLAAPIAGAALMLISIPYIVKDLGNPGDVVDFVWTLVAIPLLVAAGIAGWRAYRQRRAAGN